MAIVDQYGRDINSTYIKGAKSYGYNLPWQKMYMKDLEELVPPRDWKTLVSASRTLYANNGVVKGAIDAKAQYAIGNSWIPVFKGTDKKWGKQAQDWLLNWYEICSTTGNIDFQTLLYLNSVSMDRDGDIGIILTTNPNNYPLLQAVPSHRIGNAGDEKIVEYGTYKGLEIVNGVIRNKQGRAVAYRVLTKDSYKDVSAQTMSLLFDPSAFDQYRGLPIFSHAVSEFRQMGLSTEFELWGLLLASSIALIEHNEEGGPDDDPSMLYGSTNSTTGRPEGIGQQVMDGGMVRYFTSGSNSKLEQLNHDRPGPVWESFQDRLTRIALAGVNWPMSLTVEAVSNGTANRVEMQRAENSVSDRQSLLKPFARKAVTFAVSKAMENGDIPFNKEFWKWTFTTPKKLSIDIGRDRNARLKDYESGVLNLTQIVGEEGADLESHLYERAYEDALAIQIRQQVFAQFGLQNTPSQTN